MARVFILGAGASHFAGYPLALQLWPFVRDSVGHHAMAASRKQDVVQLVETALLTLPPEEHDRPNLEHLFTIFDLANYGVSPFTFRHANWPHLRTKLIGMISEAFMHHQHALNARTDARQTAILRAWTHSLQGGDIIITFNWDILHESALWDAGIWHPGDGYGFAQQT